MPVVQAVQQAPGTCTVCTIDSHQWP